MAAAVSQVSLLRLVVGSSNCVEKHFGRCLRISRMNQEVPDKYTLTNLSVEFRPRTPLNMVAVSLWLANGIGNTWMRTTAKLILKLLFYNPGLSIWGWLFIPHGSAIQPQPFDTLHNPHPLELCPCPPPHTAPPRPPPGHTSRHKLHLEPVIVGWFWSPQIKWCGVGGDTGLDKCG